ncbi:MAG: hypothetical protein LOY58_13780 [Gammaproteobacteria bacterium]|jgi:hypothetical protein|nr:hypothetical protein [Gammaproteobacteria bacterium]
MDLWLKILVAVVLGIMVFRLWPAASHQLRHGPKGSASDWKAAAVAIVAVVGFVLLLILMLRG